MKTEEERKIASREACKRYRTRHRERYLRAADYQNKTRDKAALNLWARQHRAKNREKQRAWWKAYYRKHHAKRRAVSKASRIKHRVKNRIKLTAYYLNRRRTDLEFRLLCVCRSRVHEAVIRQRVKKAKRTIELMGCTPDFFRAYLEAQFTRDMSWENYGKHWVIDHIIPLDSFDLKIPEQQERAFHYSNCRPLQKLLNTIKCAKSPGPHQPLLL